MPDINTVRCLSLDGGGQRGYMSNCFMRDFIQKWGVNPNEMYKKWDCISGTSIGGILSLSYAYGMSPDDTEPFFLNDGPWIFTIRTAADVLAGSVNASLPSNRPDSAQKMVILGNNDQFYNSVDPVLSNYGSTRLHTKLIETFGDKTLQDLKTAVVVPVFQEDTNTFKLFSNMNQPGFSGQNEKIVDVARATSAAPLYLPPYSFGGHVYWDGGIYLNNPSTFGLTLAYMMKPNANRACILSTGTGLGEFGFDDDPSPLRATLTFPYENAIRSLVKTLDAAMAGAQEGVAKQLHLECNYTNNNRFEYRFQPQLDKNINTNLDNTDPSFMTYLSTTEAEYFTNDDANISTFIGHLEA